MNDVIEISNLYNDMLLAYESLDQQVKQCHEITSAVKQVNELMIQVKQCGFTDQMSDAIKCNEALADITVLPIDKIVDLKATEALAETVKEGVKKFFAKIAKIIAAVIDFFGRLFNTTSSKCKTLLEKWDKINMDKEVPTFKKDKLTLIAAAVEMLSKYVKENINFTGSMIIGPDQLSQRLAALAGASKGILVASGSSSKITISEGSMQMENSTLGDAGWALNDGSKMARMYLDKSKNYTTLGSGIIKVCNGYLAGNAVLNNPQHTNFILAAYGADTSAYVCCAKLQGCVVKQIVAFWKCLEDSNIVRTNDEPKQLTAA